MNAKGSKKLSPAEEMAKLKARIAKLEETGVEEEVYEMPVIEKATIRQDDYIRVMSLVPYNLNLSTQEMGQGSIKKFTKFGEVKRIIYSDLVDIMEAHPNFMEAGYFYILHPGLIRHHGLNDVYSKILTKEKIEEILATNSEDCVPLYVSANAKQQEIIVQLLIEKIKDNPESVNLNIVDKISRISKIDISKKAEDARLAEEVSSEDVETK